jgi:hypothetical protein
MSTVLASKRSDSADRFKHFGVKLYQDTLIEAGISLAVKLQCDRVKNVVFIDRKARNANLALKLAWRQLFSDEKCPQVYFVNPEVFGEGICGSIRSRFEERYANLLRGADDKTVVFDGCIHTGKTFRLVIGGLQKAGLNDVYGIVSDNPPWWRFEIQNCYDIVFLDNIFGKRWHDTCFTFSPEWKSLVDTSPSRTVALNIVTSVRNNETDSLVEAREIREEIYRIFTGPEGTSKIDRFLNPF